MCFAPQRRTLFRYRNFQKWSEPGVFCTFWLGNVLRATTAYTFSTSQLPKVVRAWCALYILTWKCASSHNGVHFFDISTSKNGPRMICFVHFDFEMCFAPQRRAIFHLSSGQLAPHPPRPEPKIIGKTQCFTTFLPFRASASSFFWLFLFSDLLSSNLSLLSASALLCFSSVHIVGSLTSKLPSVNTSCEEVRILILSGIMKHWSSGSFLLPRWLVSQYGWLVGGKGGAWHYV